MELLVGFDSDYFAACLQIRVRWPLMSIFLQFNEQIFRSVIIQNVCLYFFAYSLTNLLQQLSYNDFIKSKYLDYSQIISSSQFNFDKQKQNHLTIHNVGLESRFLFVLTFDIYQKPQTIYKVNYDQTERLEKQIKRFRNNQLKDQEEVKDKKMQCKDNCDQKNKTQLGGKEEGLRQKEEVIMQQVGQQEIFNKGMELESCDQIKRQLYQFFQSEQQQKNRYKFSSKQPHSHKPPKTLPFSATLFSPYLIPSKSSFYEIQSLFQPQPTNPKYFFNLIIYLYPYFKNIQKRILVVQQNLDHDDANNQIQNKQENKYGRKKIVKAGYYLEELIKAIGKEEQGKNEAGWIDLQMGRDLLKLEDGQKQQQDVQRQNEANQNGVVEQVIKYAFLAQQNRKFLNSSSFTTEDKGAKSKQSSIKNHASPLTSSIGASSSLLPLTVNRLFSLPQIWLSLKMQKQMNKNNNIKDSTHVNNPPWLEDSSQIDRMQKNLKMIRIKYERYQQQIQKGVVKEMFKTVIKQLGISIDNQDQNPHQLTCFINKCTSLLSSSKHYSILHYVLNKLMLHKSCQTISNVWMEILFTQNSHPSNQIASPLKDDVILSMVIKRFVVENFFSLVKRNKFIEMLFYMWVDMREQQEAVTAISFLKSPQNILQLITLLLSSYPLHKQLYSIIQVSASSHQLLPHFYKSFFHLLFQIDNSKIQNFPNDHQAKSPIRDKNIYILLEDQNQSYIEYVFKRLAHWWGLGVDQMLTGAGNKFRWNLLAWIIQNVAKGAGNMKKFKQNANDKIPTNKQPNINPNNSQEGYYHNKDFIATYQNGSLMADISQGIQKRLIDIKYYPAAILIWTKLAKHIQGFELDQQIEKKAKYFQDQLIEGAGKKDIRQQETIKNSQGNNKIDKTTNDNQTNQQSQQQKSKQKPLQKSNSQNLPQQYQSSDQDYQQQQTYPQQQTHQLNQTQRKSPSSNINKDKNNPTQNVDSSDEQKWQSNDNGDTDGYEMVKLKAPQTLYDCILALQNPLRRKIGFTQLNKILHKRQQDVIFVWKQLLRLLMSPLQEESKQPLIKLLIIRPREWIQDIGEMYFKKDIGLNQKVLFLQILEQGINQLGENPQKHLWKGNKYEDEGNQSSFSSSDGQQFYFKRVASKYYIQKPQVVKKQPQRTKRWGHTRIAHQKQLQSQGKPTTSNLISTLLITNSSQSPPYISRLYEVINQLFFKIISKLTLQIQKTVLKQPLLAQHLIKLLGSIAGEIKNYYQKYLILEEVTVVCWKALSVIEETLRRQKQAQNKQELQKNSSPFFFSSLSKSSQSTSKSLSPIIIACLQTLNKVSLSIDKYLPPLMFQSLKQCVMRLKKIDMYGIKPLIEMLQANIYRGMNQGKE